MPIDAEPADEAGWVARQASALLDWFDTDREVTVAFSGGVDSTLVLAAAVRAVGPDHVIAVTADSVSLASGALRAAEAVADGLGVRHRTVATAEMQVSDYRRNGADRCYFCKAALFDALDAAGLNSPGSLVVTGTNADDVRAGWRPGIRAASERGAHHPLADVGFGKPVVRAVSRYWGLPTWNLPAGPCLSSRVAYGVEITPSRLARIDRAESALRSLLAEHGLATYDLRVRDLGGNVRVEVDTQLVPQIAELDDVAGVLVSAGFSGGPITVEPFRSGRLNDVLPGKLRHA